MSQLLRTIFLRLCCKSFDTGIKASTFPIGSIFFNFGIFRFNNFNFSLDDFKAKDDGDCKAKKEPDGVLHSIDPVDESELCGEREIGENGVVFLEDGEAGVRVAQPRVHVIADQRADQSEDLRKKMNQN